MFLSASQHNPLAFAANPTPVLLDVDINDASGSISTAASNQLTSQWLSAPTGTKSVYVFGLAQGTNALSGTSTLRMQSSVGPAFTTHLGAATPSGASPEMKTYGGYYMNDLDPAYVNSGNFAVYYRYTLGTTSTSVRSAGFCFDRNVNPVQTKLVSSTAYDGVAFNSNTGLDIASATFDTTPVTGNALIAFAFVHFETNVSDCEVEYIGIDAVNGWVSEVDSGHLASFPRFSYNPYNIDNNGGSQSIYRSSCIALGSAVADGSSMALSLDLNVDFGTSANVNNYQGQSSVLLVELEAA